MTSSSQKPPRFLSGSAVYLLSNVLNAAIPFALLPIITLYLSPAEYGQVAMFQTLLAALGAVVGVNVAGALARQYFEHREDLPAQRRYVAACLHILLASLVVCALPVWLFGTELADWLQLSREWVALAVAASACTVLTQMRLVQWQVRGEPRPYGVLQVSQSALNFGLSLLLVIGLAWGASGRIQAQVWAAMAAALVGMIWLHKDRLLAFRGWYAPEVRDALRFGVPLLPHAIGGFLIVSLDRVVINARMGVSDAGIYMVAVQIAAALGLVFDAINKAYVPWLFERLKRDNAQEKCQIVRLTYAWFGVLALAAVAAFWLGPWLVRLVAGERYHAAGDVVGWLALGQIFGGMYLMVTNYVFYSKQTAWLSFTTILTGMLNVALLLLLVDRFGMKGAAGAYATARGVQFLLTWWVAQRRHPMPWLG